MAYEDLFRRREDGNILCTRSMGITKLRQGMHYEVRDNNMGFHKLQDRKCRDKLRR
jgi:hypothetical protein